MKTHAYSTIIAGSGLAGLTAACHLVDQGRDGVAVVASGLGGSPLVAAFNAVLPSSSHGDSPGLYCSDMYAAGYEIGNRDLIQTLGGQTGEVVALLERWGVSFSRLDSGEYRLRRVSGSSVPRSLCRTDMLVGQHIVDILRPALAARGVTFLDQTCCGLVTEAGTICGITCQDESGETSYLTAPIVLAAWGGVGNLYKHSTYPGDVDGRTLAMAYEAGVSLVDLEFVEFEPMVCFDPPGAVGEPCPTAMLGEGAYLLNNRHERFLLAVRPEGEAGAPKSLINNAIREEVKAGRGSPLGGVYVDLRHLDEAVLRSYPWFYERVLKAGLDVKRDLLQAGPMAHSHSGGMEIDCSCMTGIDGLFAAGEAAGGMHGACRMAGNAATQAAVSGLAAAKAMLHRPAGQARCAGTPQPVETDASVRAAAAPEIRGIVTRYIEKERNADGLGEAIGRLEEIRSKSTGDTFTSQLALSGILLATAAKIREESRGTHFRTDFPATEAGWKRSIRLRRDGDRMRVEMVDRS